MGAPKAAVADEAYGLYWFQDNRVSPNPGADGVKFTGLGSIYYQDPIDGKVRVGPCALDSSGSVWYPAMDSDWNGKIVPGWDPATPMKNMGTAHRDECDTSAIPDGNLKAMSSGPAPYRINGTSSKVSADRAGTLWYTATPTPQLLPDSSEYVVHDLRQYRANSGDSAAANFGIYMLAEPRTQRNSAVAAIPTTGAPSSDLVLPAALLAAGMVGGGLLMRRRSDRNRA